MIAESRNSKAAVSYSEAASSSLCRQEVWGSWLSGLGPAHICIARSIPLPQFCRANAVRFSPVSGKQSLGKWNGLPKMTKQQNVGNYDMPAVGMCAQGTAIYTATLQDILCSGLLDNCHFCLSLTIITSETLPWELTWVWYISPITSAFHSWCGTDHRSFSLLAGSCSFCQ